MNYECIYIYVCIYLYLYMCIYMYIYMYVHIYMYIYICICIYICIYMYKYVNIRRICASFVLLCERLFHVRIIRFVIANLCWGESSEDLSVPVYLVPSLYCFCSEKVPTSHCVSWSLVTCASASPPLTYTDTPLLLASAGPEPGLLCAFFPLSFVLSPELCRMHRAPFLFSVLMCCFA